MGESNTHDLLVHKRNGATTSAQRQERSLRLPSTDRSRCGAGIDRDDGPPLWCERSDQERELRGANDIDGIDHDVADLGIRQKISEFAKRLGKWMTDFPDDHERPAPLQRCPLRERFDLTIYVESLLRPGCSPRVERKATGAIGRDQDIPTSRRRSLRRHGQQPAAQHPVRGNAGNSLSAGPVRQADALKSVGSVN